MRIVLVASLLIVAGCARTAWVSDGSGPPLQQAQARCAMEVERITPLYTPFGSPIANGMQRAHTEATCMQALGFQRARVSDPDQIVDEVQ